jgi:hypothetical protein
LAFARNANQWQEKCHEPIRPHSTVTGLASHPPQPSADRRFMLCWRPEYV